jgi:hypothetical protein
MLRSAKIESELPKHEIGARSVHCSAPYRRIPLEAYNQRSSNTYKGSELTILPQNSLEAERSQLVNQQRSCGREQIVLHPDRYSRDDGNDEEPG